MDRRSFLKTVGVATAGTALATSSSDSFGSAPIAAGSSPQFLSNGNRDRSNIQSTDLTPWLPSTAQPWDVHTINHLYRRAGFGATLAEIAIAKGKVFSDVIDSLLDDSLLKQPTVPALPTGSDKWLQVPPYLGSDLGQQMTQLNNYYMDIAQIRSHWTVQMNQPDVMLREKMTLFWMNHFNVEATKKVYYPQSMYNYLTYFRTNAWGNFKKMVSDVTTMPAMLIYLDGILNQGYFPNENYAREVQELFTMGPTDKTGNPNYTQNDVEALAAVLTGWTVDGTAPAPNILPALYNIALHNNTQQKIYDTVSRTYNLTASGYPMDMDIVDHIFDQRGDQIAWFICSKLYQFFVYHEITTDAEKAIVQQLADTFKINWSIKDVLTLLLKSSHFFDEVNIGAEIKSPYDHLIGLLRTFDLQIEELAATTIVDYAAGGSQVLLDPPNVKGWPGYHTWISTTTLPYRNNIIQTQLMAGSLVGGSMPIPLTDTIITAWGKQFENYSGTFDDLVKELATYLCAQTPSNTALGYIKKNLPPNTYEWAALSDAEKIIGLRLMTNSIMLLADYQLS
jgi:uncharacterized protein (DUF1800 family)